MSELRKELRKKSFWPFSHGHLLGEQDSWEEFEENTGLSVFEEKDKVCIEAALPGMDLDDIKVNYDKGMLLIEADKKKEEKDRKYYRKAHQSYCYQVSIPGQVQDEPKALYKNGVLTVTFPKKEERGKEKRISIEKG